MTVAIDRVPHDRTRDDVSDRARAARSSEKRADIQGLRAVAVLVVVVNHLTGQPRGGFVGVDVFFVISGYLITGLLLRDLDGRPGPARFVLEFYKRRVRRLLPAALVVTAATVYVAHVLFNEARFLDTRTDAIWSTAFLANWHFNAIGTDYFAANRPQSPFQHYWSLSVEEQFYVVWPIAIFLVVGLGILVSRRVGGNLRVPAAIVLAAGVTAVTLLVAIRQTTVSPDSAYFSTFARAWELGLGGLLAGITLLVRPGPRLATLMSWGGLALICVSIFVIRQGVAFPAPAALMPCLGSALVLAARPSRGSIVNPVLTNRLSVLVGDMSYSIYLVHFPVIVFLAAAEMNVKDGYFYISAVILSAGLSAILYYAVERPVLASRFLASARNRRSQQGAARRPRYSTGLSLGVALAFLGSAVFSLSPGDASAVAAKYQAVSEATANPGSLVSKDGSGAALQRQIRDALLAKTWPQLQPTVATELGRAVVPPDINRCAVIELQPASRCTFGPASATKTLYVVGDSTGVAYAEAYRQIVEHVTGWKVRVAAAFGCTFDTAAIVGEDPKVMAGCAQHNADVIADIDRTHPTLVVVTNTYAPRFPVGGGRPLTDKQWSADLSGELDKIKIDQPIALVEPPPWGVDPAQCYAPDSPPIACAYRLPDDHVHRSVTERELAHSRGWGYVSTEQLFCDVSAGYCPEFADGVPIKHDFVHLTYAYDDLMWPIMGSLMHEAGLLPVPRRT